MRRLKYRVFYFISAIVVSYNAVYSQSEIRFEIINQDDGLTANSVSCIFQDSTGFLWAGTRDGINRYDGVKVIPVRPTPNNNIISSVTGSSAGMLWVGTIGGGLVKHNTLTNETKTYTHDLKNTSSLSSNNITFIHADKREYLWLHTSAGGLDRFNIKTEEFTRYINDKSSESGLSSDKISYFFEDSKGRIWAGTYDSGLNLFDPNKNHFAPIVIKRQNVKVNTILNVYEDSLSNIWVATNIGLFLLDSQSPPEKPAFIAQKPAERVTAIWEDNNNVLWIAAEDNLLKLNSDGKFEEEIHLENNYILPYTIDDTPLTWSQDHLFQYSQQAKSVVVDQLNNFWMITYEGLDKYDVNNKKHLKIRSEDKFNNLNSKSISMLYKDRSGTIWLSTVGGGLYRHAESPFKLYMHKMDASTSLTDNRVVSFTEDQQDNLWIATFDGGFNKFDHKTDQFKQHKIPGATSIIFDILPIDSQNIWLATFGDGLVNYNPVKNEYEFFQYNETNNLSISENRVQRLHVDQSGTFWVGTSNGLNQFDPQTKAFKKIALNSAGTNKDVFAIAEHKKKLYLGTLGQGLIIYDPTNNKAHSYLHVNDDSSSLSNNFITNIHIDKADSNVLWIGTYGGGLNRFDILNGTFKNYNETHNLPNDVVYGILEDSEGRLWLSTNAGLSVFDKVLESVVNHYEIDDGLQANEFNRGACYQMKNGNMLFGGINGFNMFDPLDIKYSDYQAPMAITSFKIFDEDRIDLISLAQSNNREIELDHNQNFISMEFAVLDFRNVKRNQYAYRMKGLLENWSYVDNIRPFANYTGLEPGEYVFELKATNSEGVWLDEIYSLSITILPPFWQTWWFKVLIGLAIIMILRLMYMLKVRSLKAQQQRLNRLVKERTHTIQEQKEEIAAQNEALYQRNEEILTLNENLEEKVKERTQKLEESNRRLIKYSLFNSHNVRGPLARLLGLTYLSTLSSNEELRSYISKIDESAKELDEKIKEAGANLSEHLDSSD